MPQDHDCIRPDEFKRIDRMFTKLFDRFEDFKDEMHQALTSEALTAQSVDQLEKDIDRVAEALRLAKVEVKALGDWRQRFQGGVWVMLAIPVFCTVVTTGIAIYKLLQT